MANKRNLRIENLIGSSPLRARAFEIVCSGWILAFVLVWSVHCLDFYDYYGPMNHRKSNATLSYLAQFRVHQKFVQAHLKGVLNDEQPFLPAFLPPSSYWSSDEKDLFFHALAVYSRFRPDLIAESIKTKTIFDVCLYLDILQTASSPIHSDIHGSHTTSLEPAMEVSSAWIQREEKFAAALTQLDSSEPPAAALKPKSYKKRQKKTLSDSSRKDSESLAPNNNLDFFHPSFLARLMRCYGSSKDLTRPPDEVSFSADTIQLIVDILKEFVSEVVRSSLISKEQEICIKGSLKVWKYNQNEITVENVMETLKSMGIAHLKSKDCFAEGSNGISLPVDHIDTEMGTKDDDNNSDSAGDQDEDEDEASNEDNPSNASDASKRSSQSLTELWLPQSLRRCLLPKYFQVSENEDDDILSEIDEIGLQCELKEEEELDVRDLLASREYEAELLVL